MAYYNQVRYRESLDNVTPADVQFRKEEEMLQQREQIKQRTPQAGRRYHVQRAGR